MDSQTRLRHFCTIGCRLVALAVGAVLVAAGLAKFAHLDAFRAVLIEHGLLTGATVHIATIGFPTAECLVGLHLVFSGLGSERRCAAALLLGGVLFLGTSAYAIGLSIDPPPKPVPCGCGFSIGPVNDWRPIAIRNGVFAALLPGIGLALRKSAHSRAQGA